MSDLDILEILKSRRSIRKFLDKKVESEKIHKILEVAMSAPSARNQQPWRFVIIDNRDTLDTIAEQHPYAKMLKTAPLAIAICGKVENECEENYWTQDCSASTENLLLATHVLGLGAVWISIYPKEERMQILIDNLELPKSIKPLALVAVGYANENKEKEDRFDREKIFFNKFS